MKKIKEKLSEYGNDKSDRLNAAGYCCNMQTTERCRILLQYADDWTLQDIAATCSRLNTAGYCCNMQSTEHCRILLQYADDWTLQDIAAICSRLNTSGYCCNMQSTEHCRILLQYAVYWTLQDIAAICSRLNTAGYCCNMQSTEHCRILLQYAVDWYTLAGMCNIEHISTLLTIVEPQQMCGRWTQHTLTRMHDSMNTIYILGILSCVGEYSYGSKIRRQPAATLNNSLCWNAHDSYIILNLVIIKITYCPFTKLIVKIIYPHCQRSEPVKCNLNIQSGLRTFIFNYTIPHSSEQTF